MQLKSTSHGAYLGPSAWPPGASGWPWRKALLQGGLRPPGVPGPSPGGAPWQRALKGIFLVSVFVSSLGSVPRGWVPSLVLEDVFIVSKDRPSAGQCSLGAWEFPGPCVCLVWLTGLPVCPRPSLHQENSGPCSQPAPPSGWGTQVSGAIPTLKAPGTVHLLTHTRQAGSKEGPSGERGRACRVVTYAGVCSPPGSQARKDRSERR